MKVRSTLVSEVREYENNARQHSEEQIKQLMQSIQQFGWAVPIAIDRANVVIAGHARLEAAKRLGYERVPCAKLDLDEKEANALRILDNSISDQAVWDWTKLDIELGELTDPTMLALVRDTLNISNEVVMESSYTTNVDLNTNGEVDDPATDEAVEPLDPKVNPDDYLVRLGFTAPYSFVEKWNRFEQKTKDDQSEVWQRLDELIA